MSTICLSGVQKDNDRLYKFINNVIYFRFLSTDEDQGKKALGEIYQLDFELKVEFLLNTSCYHSNKVG